MINDGRVIVRVQNVLKLFIFFRQRVILHLRRPSQLIMYHGITRRIDITACRAAV